MTKEFKEMVDRLEKARNFEDGSYLLITQCGNEGMSIVYKGAYGEILAGIEVVVEDALKKVPDNEAQKIRGWLKYLIVKDEDRRFQEGAGE